MKIDDLTVKLPEGWQVNTMPAPQSQDAKLILYNLKVESSSGEVHVVRKFNLNLTYIPSDKYLALRNFFQLIRNGDEEQILLRPAVAPTGNRRSTRLRGLAALFLGLLFCAPWANAGDAPAWMHAQANVPLPAYDEKTDAVLLYSETNVTVVASDKIRTTVREVYKILRPDGRRRGTVAVYFNPQRKVKSLHGWCIPAQGKDYDVKDKDAIEVSPNTEGGELISDVKYRIVQIPAADPGNIVGYEYEVEERPFFLQDMWAFQERDPVRESHYSLQLPPGWEFKASWLNHLEVKPADGGNNLWQWSVSDITAIRTEPAMPPVRGVMGQMIITLFPPGGDSANNFASWDDLGKWMNALMAGRMDASPKSSGKSRP